MNEDNLKYLDSGIWTHVFLKTIFVSFPWLLFASLGILLASDGSFILMGIMFVFMIVALLTRRYVEYLLLVEHLSYIHEGVIHGSASTASIGQRIASIKDIFVVGSMFFVVDRINARMASELKKFILSNGLLSQIPFISAVLHQSTTHIDECLVGYTLLTNRTDKLFEAVMDGLTVYVLNIVQIMKNSIKLILIQYVLSIGSWIILSIYMIFLWWILGFYGFWLLSLVYMLVHNYVGLKCFLSTYKCFLIHANKTELPHSITESLFRHVHSLNKLKPVV